MLRSLQAELLILDSRVEGSASASSGAGETANLAFRVLAAIEDLELNEPLPRPNRLLAIVPGGRRGAEHAHRFGLGGADEVLGAPDLDEIAHAIRRLGDSGPPGKVAICLAGGGIEGLLYELGVLRALDAFLASRPIVDFDLFCGISAGAMIASFLANGLGPEEILRGLTYGSARLERIRRRDIFDLNLRGVGRRSLSFLGAPFGREKVEAGRLVSLSGVLPCGIFAGDRLRDYLQRQLTRPGMSDRFEDLRRPLFVGATDQDTSEAVVFGELGLRHVPIHRAVRASTALVPLYDPEEIDGRYYIDGAFTRTTNMRVAVNHGATLVILVDPLVPVFAEQPGYVQARGGMFASTQGLKSLINGRFDKAVRALRQLFPDVHFYLFRPEGEEMRALAGSPMKYFYRREISDIAFENTVRKIRNVLPDMSRVFARHSIVFRDPEYDDPRSAASRPRPLPLDSLGIDR